METDAQQNIELRYITDAIKELKTLYEKYESKNCSKHDLILATINISNGKWEEKFEQLREKVITSEQYDRMLESQTGRNMMMQKDIKETGDRVEALKIKNTEIEGKLKNILVYFSIIGTAIIIGIDIVRKRLGI